MMCSSRQTDTLLWALLIEVGGERRRAGVLCRRRLPRSYVARGIRMKFYYWVWGAVGVGCA